MDYSEYMISGHFYKLGDSDNYLQFGLNPDKSYSPSSWNYPVTWSGRVGWKDVSIVQTTRDDIDFSSIPHELLNSIPHIQGKIEAVIMKLD